MTVRSARLVLVSFSLSLCALLLAFFLLAPFLGFPLQPPQAVRLLEIVLPVFLGYLGSAAQFVFRSPQESSQTLRFSGKNSLAALLIWGPLAIFAGIGVALLVVFGISNSATAPDGAGMDVDQLAVGLTTILGLLAVTTGVAVSYLFSTAPPRQARGD